MARNNRRTCNLDCSSCRYSDCVNDTIDELEEYKAHLLDSQITKEKETKPEDRHSRYRKTQKFKYTQKKYNQTEKGKETKRRSEKNYAARHPERVRAKQRLYYERHKEEIKLRRMKKEYEKTS